MKDLIKITEEEFGVILDLKYFTQNNITNDLIYDKGYNFLHIEAANKLRESIKLAKEKGYKLKIFDAYRPIKYQQYLYDKFPGDYVSNRCGIHVIEQNGKSLMMSIQKSLT